MSTRFAVLWVALVGCKTAEPYVCQTNAQCVDGDEAGMCEPDSLCSFADTTCSTTNRRYATSAGDKAGTCVVADSPGCIEAITGGDQHFCLIRTDGSIWCWGANESGQLGNSSTMDSALPVEVRTPAGKSFVEVTASENHSCGLASDHTTWCWGANDT